MGNDKSVTHPTWLTRISTLPGKSEE